MDQRSTFWARSLSLPFLLLAFLAGMLVERQGWLPGSRAYVPAQVGDTFDPFWEAWAVVEKHYVDRKAVQPKKMTEGAIEGMLASLGDLYHTTYLTREQLAQMQKSLKGSLEGIGARMTIRKQQPTIVQTMPASPARKAGLRPGDVLLEVDGKPVTSLPISRVAELVRGTAGTPVKLRITREGLAKARTVTIIRGHVDVPFLAWAMLPDLPIAHVAIQEFGEDADAQLKAALAKAREGGAKGLLVDMRGNPGGLKDQAVAVTSEFLPDGIVFVEQDAEGKRTDIPVKPGGTATDIPMVVLIDEGSASSAEIFAGAIQDHQRAKLVGMHTFGTGTVLRPFLLSDGSAVMLAVMEWLTPAGRQIWHKGITPDKEVPLPAGADMVVPEQGSSLSKEALAKSNDQQLLQGLEILQEQMRAGLNRPAVRK